MPTLSDPGGHLVWSVARVGAGDSATLRDLLILVEEAAEPILSDDLGLRIGGLRGSAADRELVNLGAVHSR